MKRGFKETGNPLPTHMFFLSLASHHCCALRWHSVVAGESFMVQTSPFPEVEQAVIHKKKLQEREREQREDTCYRDTGVENGGGSEEMECTERRGGRGVERRRRRWRWRAGKEAESLLMKW